MRKLLTFKPYVYKEPRVLKRAREREEIFREDVLIATTRGGLVATSEVDSNDSNGLSGQPIGLLLALTYA